MCETGIFVCANTSKSNKGQGIGFHQEESVVAVEEVELALVLELRLLGATKKYKGTLYIVTYCRYMRGILVYPYRQSTPVFWTDGSVTDFT